MPQLPLPLQPELLAPFSIGTIDGTHFAVAVEPITDSYIAKQAENTLKGLVHLWVVSPDGTPFTQEDLTQADVSVDKLAGFILTKREVIKAKYLPGRYPTNLRLEHYYIDQEGVVQVSFILYERGVRITQN